MRTSNTQTVVEAGMFSTYEIRDISDAFFNRVRYQEPD